MHSIASLFGPWSASFADQQKLKQTDLSNNFKAAKGDCGWVLHKPMQQGLALIDTANSLLREVGHLEHQASVLHNNLSLLMNLNKVDFDCENFRHIQIHLKHVKLKKKSQ